MGTKLVKKGPKRVKTGQNGSNWSKRVKKDQTGATRFITYQNGSTKVKLVNKGQKNKN